MDVKDEVKLSLKLMVDKQKNRVAFAEARKDFVDFIFHLLSLPLNTVVEHLKDKGMPGCLESVHDSFHSLDSEYFQPFISEEFTPSLDTIIPKLSFISNSDKTALYKCPSHPLVSPLYYRTCPESQCYKRFTSPAGLEYVSGSSYTSYPGFVKEVVSYMVMDDLEVEPMTISVLKDRFSDLGDLEEKVVQVGVDEAVEILEASLETKAVLTTVFLKEKDFPGLLLAF